MKLVKTFSLLYLLFEQAIAKLGWSKPTLIQVKSVVLEVKYITTVLL
jgi:hypothetical protein